MPNTKKEKSGGAQSAVIPVKLSAHSVREAKRKAIVSKSNPRAIIELALITGVKAIILNHKNKS